MKSPKLKVSTSTLVGWLDWRGHCFYDFSPKPSLLYSLERNVTTEPPAKVAKTEPAEDGPGGDDAKDGEDKKAAPETEADDAAAAEKKEGEETQSDSVEAKEEPTSTEDNKDKEKEEEEKPNKADENEEKATEAGKVETTGAKAEPTSTEDNEDPKKEEEKPNKAESAATAENPASSEAETPSLPPGLPGTGPPVATTGADGVTAAVAPADPEAIVEEKGEVSSLYVGRVIGKGGEMIRDLQARSGARIDVDQSVPPGRPRVITYRGTRKTVDFAKRLVYMLCQENVNEADLPLGEATREYLVVPASSVGKIIGRGGEMIRELQSRSHAKIQVDHGGSSGFDGSEKNVTITGTEQSVVKGKEMILFLVANPNMDAMQSLNMLVEDKVQRGGVWGSGPPYPNLPQNGQNMQPSTGGYGYDQSYYGGAPSGGAAGYPTSAGAYGAPAPAPYQQPPAASFGGGMETEIFPAAKTYMGRIIGSRGVTINDLQRRSACDIQINQDVPPGRDCEITIRGTRQGIEMVKQMLREIIAIGPNHPYAGGGGGGGGQGKLVHNSRRRILFVSFESALTESLFSSLVSVWRIPTRWPCNAQPRLWRIPISRIWRWWRRLQSTILWATCLWTAQRLPWRTAVFTGRTVCSSSSSLWGSSSRRPSPVRMEICYSP